MALFAIKSPIFFIFTQMLNNFAIDFDKQLILFVVDHVPTHNDKKGLKMLLLLMYLKGKPKF